MRLTPSAVPAYPPLAQLIQAMDVLPFALSYLPLALARFAKGIGAPILLTGHGGDQWLANYYSLWGDLRRSSRIRRESWLNEFTGNRKWRKRIGLSLPPWSRRWLARRSRGRFLRSVIRKEAVDQSWRSPEVIPYTLPEDTRRRALDRSLAFIRCCARGADVAEMNSWASNPKTPSSMRE